MILFYITEEMANNIALEYYKDNCKKLNKMVDTILVKLKFYDVRKDDFYDLASEVFCDALKRYDGKQNFNGFLYRCLSNKFKTEMTNRNRLKRKADKMAISWEIPINNGEDKNRTVGSIVEDTKITTSYDIDNTFFNDDTGNKYSEKMMRYISRLSPLQRNVLRLIIAGYSHDEIRETLHISQAECSDAISAIHSYRNVSILF